MKQTIQCLQDQLNLLSMEAEKDFTDLRSASRSLQKPLQVLQENISRWVRVKPLICKHTFRINVILPCSHNLEKEVLDSLNRRVKEFSCLFVQRLRFSGASGLGPGWPPLLHLLLSGLLSASDGWREPTDARGDVGLLRPPPQLCVW